MWGLLRRTQRSMWKDRGRVSVVGVGSVLKTIDRVGGLKLIPGSVRVFGGSNWTGNNHAPWPQRLARKCARMRL